jgi:hypothetical protein
MENRILDLVKELHTNLESNWRLRFEELNIWERVHDLYFEYDKELKKMKPRFGGQMRISNTIFSYIVFAYHNSSKWLDLHKDRNDNKNEIMASLAGISYQTEDAYCKAIIGIDEPFNSIIEWVIDMQMDRRWKQIMADFEYHSNAQNISKFARGAKDMTDAGRMLSLAEVRLESATKLLEILRNENVKLDSALTKENRNKLTERTNSNFMSWENFIRRRDDIHQFDLDAESGGNLDDYEVVN